MAKALWPPTWTRNTGKRWNIGKDETQGKDGTQGKMKHREKMGCNCSRKCVSPSSLGWERAGSGHHLFSSSSSQLTRCWKNHLWLRSFFPQPFISPALPRIFPLTKTPQGNFLVKFFPSSALFPRPASLCLCSRRVSPRVPSLSFFGRCRWAVKWLSPSSSTSWQPITTGSWWKGSISTASSSWHFSQRRNTFGDSRYLAGVSHGCSSGITRESLLEVVLEGNCG